MYEIVPSYVERRIKEVEGSEQKLPFEPSFGWVGRTDFHVPYNLKCEKHKLKPSKGKLVVILHF